MASAIASYLDWLQVTLCYAVLHPYRQVDVEYRYIQLIEIFGKMKSHVSAIQEVKVYLKLDGDKYSPKMSEAYLLTRKFVEKIGTWLHFHKKVAENTAKQRKTKGMVKAKLTQSVGPRRARWGLGGIVLSCLK